MTTLKTIAMGALLVGVANCAEGPATRPNADPDAADRTEIDAMYADYRKDFPDVKEISAEELVDLRKREDVVVVDVREPREMAVSMIPGAISKTEFEQKIDEFKNRPIVTHCTIGYRSGVYAEELKQRGIDAMNLKGSILSWVHAGQPVVDAEGRETKRVHVYGKKWDLLPEGYEAVW